MTIAQAIHQFVVAATVSLFLATFGYLFTRLFVNRKK
jgi:hypothetical protein